jgi:hypothetical protein
VSAAESLAIDCPTVALQGALQLRTCAGARQAEVAMERARQHQEGGMSMFEHSVALEAFRTFLDGRGLSEATLSIRDGFEAMLDFYETVRAGDCTSESADMLLFQWGTYDRAFLPRGGGTGMAFDINIVRQLIPDIQDDDDDIWQLELNFEFEPTDKLRALGRDHRWCHSLQELRDFRDYTLTSEPCRACSDLIIRQRFLDYQCAG